MLDPKKKPALVKEIKVKLEGYVVEAVEAMSSHTGISSNEIINTALRRFIATHKDYFPTANTGKPTGRFSM